MIDILHPAHVHFFRYFITAMEADGHLVLVTTRSKDNTLDLLDQLHNPSVKISDARTGIFGMGRELIGRTRAFVKLGRSFKPDVLMGEHGTTIAIAGKILRVPSLVYWDTEVAKLVNSITYPLATVVYTPTSYTGKVHGQQEKYKGYQKLAYLHPKWFRADPTVLAKYEMSDGFVLVRFVSFKYNHDKGCVGIVDKIKFVRELAKHRKVYVSCEGGVPSELSKYELKIDFKDIFDVMAFAGLYVGESPTMATEAALLGVPSVYVSNSPRGYISELASKYGMVVWAKTESEGLQESLAILKDTSSLSLWTSRREKMLSEMIDVTSWMIETVKGRGWGRRNKIKKKLSSCDKI